MNCPVCGSNTNVISSRRDCEGVYRARVCKSPKCEYRFFTTEIESDREDYDRVNRERNNERNRRRQYNKKHNKNYNKIG